MYATLYSRIYSKKRSKNISASTSECLNYPSKTKRPCERNFTSILKILTITNNEEAMKLTMGRTINK